MKAATEGNRWARLKLAAGALHALLKDPNDTRQVFILSIAVNGPHVPQILSLFLSNESGCELFRRGAAIDKTSVDYDALRALPADTLGGAYARFLDDNGLDPDLFQAPPGVPPAQAYVAQRMRQTHDLWHVLTGYSTEVRDEIAIIAFTYGQTGTPSMRLLAFLGALRYSLQEENVIGHVWRAYRRGKETPFMGNAIWEDMWHLPLGEVRQRVGLS